MLKFFYRQDGRWRTCYGGVGVLSQEDPTGPAQLHGKDGFHMGNSSPVLKKKKKKKGTAFLHFLFSKCI